MQKISRTYDRRKYRTMTATAFFLLMGVSAGLLAGCEKTESKPEEKQTQETGQTQLEQSQTLTDSEYLLTVDGYGVTEDEFLMFLRDQKAATANYYWVNYEMQPDKEFWRTEVDGQTPLDYAKERALSLVVEAKEEFILADERGILDYRDYDDMVKDMETENQERAEKEEKGETVYGILEYTPFTYYQYHSGNARAELENQQIEQTDPTEEELREIYEENKETLSLGDVYHYTVHYKDGTQEKISQNTREIGKEESTKEDLIYNYFPTMKPGEVVKDYNYQGKQADIEFQGVDDLGYASFEESESSLRAFYAKKEISDLIAKRTENAEIKIDKERYDALEMP